MKSGAFGQWGEDYAARYLQGIGYELVERNWRCRYGELDLVMRHGEVWVFVEVKARRSEAFGTAEESVTVGKRRHLLETARAYLAEHGLTDVDWRIDVVTLTVARGEGPPAVEIYPNAVMEW